LSHFIGVPRVGDIDEEFDRCFLDVLERGDMDAVLDLPDEELELAGNGAHEIRSWLAVAVALAPARGQTMSYEPIYPWITGMAVARFQPIS
jgi:aromatic ring-opening dioxygenase LigB subunit